MKTLSLRHYCVMCPLGCSVSHVMSRAKFFDLQRLLFDALTSVLDTWGDFLCPPLWIGANGVPRLPAAGRRAIGGTALGEMTSPMGRSGAMAPPGDPRAGLSTGFNKDDFLQDKDLYPYQGQKVSLIVTWNSQKVLHNNSATGRTSYNSSVDFRLETFINWIIFF